MDANAWHFMRNPRQLAWGRGGLFATCGEARTANYEDDATPYNGPVLWDSNPELFGAPYDPNRNGTHVDMLHETPYCMGIAHERGNVYWAFNGDAGALDRYDFNQPHEPGGEDHTDGALWRYAEGELSRVEPLARQPQLAREHGVRAVREVTSERVAHGGHVHANLVRAPRLKVDLHE